MGLFDVHMPIIYGEGAKKAFRRLQIEIMQISFDQSLLAWRSDSRSSSGLLATSWNDSALECKGVGCEDCLFHWAGVGKT